MLLTAIFKNIAILIVKLYQKIISPYFPGCCRFNPTCSNYAISAFNKYGFFKGLWLTLRRLLKCHPFGGSGHDPLP
ncbi:MAG: membrane protein insertion efficiency factor YidD [Rickettsiales bacterium]